MNEKQKPSQIKRTVIISIAVITALALLGTLMILNRDRITALSSSNPELAIPPVQSKFSFNASTAQGWSQGATNNTSMAVFNESKSCFVSAEYKSGAVVIDTELQKSLDILTKEGYTVTQGAVQTLTIQTSDGSRQYDLHTSTVVTPDGANKVKGGQEFGYVELPDGYLKIMGYCDTAEELPVTISALQAFKYDNSK